jgi:hypothetical protein
VVQHFKVLVIRISAYRKSLVWAARHPQGFISILHSDPPQKRPFGLPKSLYLDIDDDAIQPNELQAW